MVYVDVDSRDGRGDGSEPSGWCVQADTRAAGETRGFAPKCSVSPQLRSGTGLAIGTAMLLIALLPSLVAGWLFVGTLRLRGAKTR